MSLFTPWDAVYTSTDLAEVMKRETVLSDHGIRFKTSDDSGRLAMDNRGGVESAALSRGGLQSVTYRILVKRDKAESARYHLSQDK